MRGLAYLAAGGVDVSVPFAKGTTSMPPGATVTRLISSAVSVPFAKGTTSMLIRSSFGFKAMHCFSPLREGDDFDACGGSSAPGRIHRFSPLREGDDFDAPVCSRRLAPRAPRFSPLREGDDFDARIPSRESVKSAVSVPFAKGTTSMPKKGGTSYMNTSIVSVPFAKGTTSMRLPAGLAAADTVGFSPLREGDDFDAPSWPADSSRSWCFSPLREGDDFDATEVLSVPVSFSSGFSPLREGDDFDALQETRHGSQYHVSVPFAKGTTSMQTYGLLWEIVSGFQSPSRRGRLRCPSTVRSPASLYRVSVPFAKGTTSMRTSSRVVS